MLRARRSGVKLVKVSLASLLFTVLAIERPSEDAPE
jgi:hypothetical protein